MVDRRAQVSTRQLWQTQRNLRLSQFMRMQSKLARSYTDDIDIRQGALSAPCNRFRPGQRDDAIRCLPASMVTIL